MFFTFWSIKNQSNKHYKLKFYGDHKTNLQWINVYSLKEKVKPAYYSTHTFMYKNGLIQGISNVFRALCSTFIGHNSCTSSQHCCYVVCTMLSRWDDDWRKSSKVLLLNPCTVLILLLVFHPAHSTCLIYYYYYLLLFTLCSRYLTKRLLHGGEWRVNGHWFIN